ASGKGGAVATADGVATNAATRVLRRGGNAVDAAIAAAAVLGVVEPYSCGIGGGGFMVVRTPDGRVTTFDSREKSPAAMQPDSFFENGAALPMPAARYSGLSAGVPGTVRGWTLALRRLGSRPLAELLRPAIAAARDGFVVDETFANQTAPNVPWFDDLPATAAIFLDPDGTPRDVGATLQNPDLARTLRRIARLGVAGFYRGPVARAIARAVQQPPTGPGADQTWRPGLMTEADLRGYRALERTPTRIDYRGWDVFSMGPPSSGGTTVGEALNILEQIQGYPQLPEADKLHSFIEASRYSFADRGAYLGDPAFSDVPVSTLLSDAFAASRRAAITQTAANATVPPAAIGTPPSAAVAAASRPEQSTTHLTVADDDGMVVTYTFTIESTGGNGIVVPGWGFLLNNELTDFTYNATTGPNRAEGGKRPRSSIAPTYVEFQGRPLLAVGSPGGASIITTVLYVLTQRLDFGRTLPEAIALPRASQRNNPTTEPEQAFLDAYGAVLAAPPYGHAFGTAAAELGAVTGIEFRRRGRMLAAAEPVRRGGGNAQVVSAGRTRPR
ncbi:MAG TPA: gamma-glutamyltransferase, partial [Solirubrobacteraceae bacterium]|nr:gamma-glutamyltransferase [Solirubrobacteraceae bacterium]